MDDLSVIVCLAFDHRADAIASQRFKECICRCSFVETAVEVSGTFDMIVQGSCGSLAEYNEHMERLRPHIAQFVSRLEANFICSKIERTKETDTLWLPCEGGRKRVEAHMIDKVLAEGDYMRVHVGSWNCLIHHTMRRLCEQLKNSNFIMLRRSALVRADFIDRVVHDERRWKARLCDGTHVIIAQSRAQEVLHRVCGDSSKPRLLSSTDRQLEESSSHVIEMAVQAKS